jgi:TolB protein
VLRLIPGAACLLAAFALAFGGYAGATVPEGPRVAFTKWGPNPRSITLMSAGADGSGVRRLAGGTKPAASHGPLPFDGPTWSPDGSRIAYSSNVTGTMQLWTIPAGGGPEKMLTDGYERMYHPFFSPDGRWLYIQPSHRNIYRLPADGGPLAAVTTFPESGLFLEEPTISPDGRWLAYCRSNGGASLWLLTMSDASKKQ